MKTSAPMTAPIEPAGSFATAPRSMCGTTVIKKITVTTPVTMVMISCARMIQVKPNTPSVTMMAATINRVISSTTGFPVAPLPNRAPPVASTA